MHSYRQGTIRALYGHMDSVGHDKDRVERETHRVQDK
jgi:hypothetical protein